MAGRRFSRRPRWKSSRRPDVRVGGGQDQVPSEIVNRDALSLPVSGTRIHKGSVTGPKYLYPLCIMDEADFLELKPGRDEKF